MLLKVKSVHFRSLVILFHKTFHRCFPWSLKFCFKGTFSKYFHARFISVFLYKCGLGLSLANLWHLIAHFQALIFLYVSLCNSSVFANFSARMWQNYPSSTIFKNYIFCNKCTHLGFHLYFKGFCLFLSTSSQNILGVVSCWDYPWQFC